MARSRWGKPPALRGTLGTLLRTTWQQVGQMREVAARGAQTGRVRIDGALLARRRRDALTALGEEIYELAARGELGELEAVAGVRERLAELEELDEALTQAEERALRGGGGRAATPPTAAGRGEPMRVWRPVRPDGAAARGDGTSARGDGEPMRVWRPVRPDGAGARGDGASAAEPEAAVEPQETRPARRRPRRPKRAARGGGGITFVDQPPVDGDEDLSEYMHADDVPARGKPARGKPADDPDGEEP